MKNIVIGLLCVMLSNTFLGVTISTFKCEFCLKRLFAGLFKSICIIVGIGLMYLCGVLNPDIIVADVAGISMNLADAVKSLFIAGIIVYGYKDLVKLKELLNVSTSIVAKKDENTKVVSVPVDNNIKGGMNEVQ